MKIKERIWVFFIVLTMLLPILFYGLSASKVEDSLYFAIATLVVMSIVGIFFIEHFFTKPNDILTNSITVFIVFLSVIPFVGQKGVVFWVWIGYLVLIFILVFLAMTTHATQKTQKGKQTLLSKRLYHLIASLGKAKVIYPISIIILSLLYVDVTAQYTLFICLYMILILTINTNKAIIGSFLPRKKSPNALGELSRVHGLRRYSFEVFEGQAITVTDCVQFVLEKGSIRRSFLGTVFAINRTISNTIAEVVVAEETSIASNSEIHPGLLYGRKREDSDLDLRNQVVGFAIQHTQIDRIVFRHNILFEHDIEQGMLVYCRKGTDRVHYQIVDSKIGNERIENQDAIDMIQVEATQLGSVSENGLTFEKYGWIPSYYEPIFAYSQERKITYAKNHNEAQIGHLKYTDIPVYVDLDLSVTHHTAIFGITGSGKSVFARQHIKNLADHGTKVFCIDFTNEYTEKLKTYKPVNLIDTVDEASIAAAAEKLGIELSKFKNQQNSSTIEDAREVIRRLFKKSIESFVNSKDSNVAILNLPDVSNNEGILEYTKDFMVSIIAFAKTTNGKHKICVAIEEAHTVIPEWNFVGIDDKTARPLVNVMSQVALQGRKYNLGFLIIAQRTANVSKTIVTQCNSMVLFNQFDNTSKDFLSNYIGQDYAKMLSSLRPREAICVGAAFKSGVPMVFRVPEINEHA
jgi:uncharacterized protein